MTELLDNVLAGRVCRGQGPGTTLVDPVHGTPLVRVDATGLDLAAGYAHARETGGAGLRALDPRQRGQMLAAIVSLLQSRREAYHEIARANSGTVRQDSALDIDGAIYTLSTYARLAAQLPDAPGQAWLPHTDALSLAKDGSFQTRHIASPVAGLALFINAFNFPAWGLWEKAAPALLAGVPVVLKPATATAWLAQRMVLDVIEAGLLPDGALSVVCGGSDGLLDALQPFDVLSFTGSAATAATLRGHPAITHRGVRINVEADSVNSALLMPGTTPDSPAFGLFVDELVREMTVKSGQKCTAIRRAFVPDHLRPVVAEAVQARLAAVSVGDPREAAVQMGALVNRRQFDDVTHGLERLRTATRTVFDGRRQALVGALDPRVACCMAPTLLAIDSPQAVEDSALVHDLEVFGPVATLLPYADLPQAVRQVRRGQGSLVVSLYGEDAPALARTAVELANHHGRVHVVSPESARSHTGHGNVMPQSLHGGPGRAGGGEELGGLQALAFYQRRTAIQAAPSVLAAL